MHPASGILVTERDTAIAAQAAVGYPKATVTPAKTLKLFFSLQMHG